MAVCTAVHAEETFHLVTENYPPFNMSTSEISASGEEISGISTEIVRELFQRAGFEYTIKQYPWQRAYNMALKTPYHGVFSTTVTEERKPLFHWVGPLVENNWVLFARKDRNITIKTLDDARQYTIGGYNGDATAIYLQEQGFDLELTALDHLNARMIAKNRIDLWATGELSGAYYARQEGVTDLEVVFELKKVELSLAFNTTVPPAIIETLNTILQHMHEDGAIEAIYTRYR
jgi:polar amino acid transport system substrate-binding protein